MSKVGELSVVITADASQLKKGLKGTQLQLKKFSQEIRGNINQWAKWGAAAASAASVATSAIVKHQLSAIKEIKNLADASNTSVDKFQRGAYAADQAGISMEKYGDILKDTTERIGEFSSIGAGPMIDFFENIAPKVGVTADQFKKLSGQDALQLYVKSLEDANLSQQQMTFYMETIASDSVRLLPLLKDNSKAMKEQAARAKELGVGLDDIDVAQAMAAQQALKDSSIAVDAAMKNATVAIAPYITEIMKQFEGTIGTVDEFAEIIGQAMSYGGKVVGVFADGLHGIRVIFAGLEVLATGFGAALSLTFAGLMKATTALGNAIINGIAWPIREILKLAAPFSDIATDALKGVDELVASIEGKVPDAVMNFAAAQVEATEIAKNAFNEMALQQLPSESIEQWVSRVKEGVIQAAEQTRIAVAETLLQKNEDTDTKGTDPAENLEALKIREETEAIIEALSERYIAEEESMVDYYARINAAIAKGEADGTITKANAVAARKQLKKDEQRFEIDTITSTMGSIVSALSIGGKKSQKIAQKIAVTKAIISGGQAAVDAWKAGMSTGGPWAPVVAAAYTAASLARTGSMISSLRSGSKASSPGGSLPSVPTGSTPQQQAAPQAAAPQAVHLSLQGNSRYSKDEVRGLFEQFNEALGDGMELNIVTG